MLTNPCFGVKQASWNVFVINIILAVMGGVVGCLALAMTGSAYGSGFALCTEEDSQNASHAR